MTDYLTRLTARTLGLMPVVQPLIPSRYAPSTQALAGGLEMTEESQVTERAMPVPDQPLRHTTLIPVSDSRMGVEENQGLGQETRATEESVEAVEESRLPEQRIRISAQESTLNVVTSPSPGVTPAASAVTHGQTAELGNGIAFHAGMEVMREQVATAVSQGAVPAGVPISPLQYRTGEPEQWSSDGVGPPQPTVLPLNKADSAAPNETDFAAPKAGPALRGTLQRERPVFGVPPVFPTVTAATTSLQPEGTVTGTTVATHPANLLPDDVAVAPDKGILRPPATAVAQNETATLQPEPPVAGTPPAAHINSIRQQNNVVAPDRSILHPPVATVPPEMSISSEGRRPTSYPGKLTEVSTYPDANLLPSEPPPTPAAGWPMADRLPQPSERQALRDTGGAAPAVPTVHVTIGRIEVRAITPPPAPVPDSTPRRSGPALSLDDYLKLRNGAGR